MTTHVLVPMDYSEQSRTALACALDDFPEATVTALHVIDFRSSDHGPGGFGTANAWEDWIAAAREHADELLAGARELASEHGREIRTETVVGEDSRSILEYVDEHDVDRVYVGSHGHSAVERLLLGTVTEKVVRRSPVPVTVVR